MSQDKVLLISCYFPPAGGINVQRAVSLARYLPQNGFQVHVLTARSSVPMADAELVNLVPKDVKVYRTWTLEPPFRLRKKLWGRINSSAAAQNGKNGLVEKAKSVLAQKVKRLICPDPQVLWYLIAIRRATKLIHKENIQTVLVTAPPFSSFLIVNELKRQFPHLHAIADVRDEWLDYFVKEFVFCGDEYVSARAARIERETVESCDRIVNVTQASSDRMRARYPDQPDHKFVLIPNGYDPAVFSEFRSRPHQLGRLVFTYTGTVYRPASPKTFLDALYSLPQIRPEVQIRFVGRIAEEFDRSIFENRQTSVQVTDFVPQKVAHQFLEETDVLLLPWTDRVNIPGKFYEYLITGKPILALCYPDSEVARLMEQTSAGWCVNPDDAAAIQRALVEIHRLGGKYPHARNWEAIRRFERPRLAAEYARVIRDAHQPQEQVEFANFNSPAKTDREPGRELAAGA